MRGSRTGAGRRYSLPARRHILITGFPRCGTTLFHQMLVTSAAGFHFVPEEAKAERYIRRRQSYITKRPLDVFQIDDIFAANRGRKKVDLVILVRDSRGVVCSRHALVPDTYYIGYEIRYKASRKGHGKLRDPGIVGIDRVIRQHLKDERFSNCVLLRFEDLVLRTDEVQQRLKDVLDLEYDASFSDFHKHPASQQSASAMNGVRPIETARVDSWKATEHRARIVEQFAECPRLFDLLIEYGYEDDTTWFDDFCEGDYAELLASRRTSITPLRTLMD